MTLRFALALAAALLATAPAFGQDSHRKEDADKHARIAAAHEAAAACLQAGGKDCHDKLRAACKGIAVGPHCGLIRQPGEFKDEAAHLAAHRQMAAVHGAAAKCLQGSTDYKQCQAQLMRDCGGIGIGKYCGMRHSH
ncbi:MAG: hypothetical protein LW847_03350 [Burkholderiales bacterium]|jgi:hypothetical protein|nr:hypothetical protein [Burkholderiales bacterium]